MENTKDAEIQQLQDLTAQCGHIWKTPLEVPIQMEQSTLVRSPARMPTSTLHGTDKGWNYTVETLTWDSEFQFEKLTFQSLLKVTNKSLCVASQGEHEAGGSEFLCAMKRAHLCLDVPTIHETRALLE